MSDELALKDIESAFREYPQVKQYAIDYIKEYALDEAKIFGRSKALAGELENIFVTDMATYIGAPILAKRVIGKLILEHGSYVMERAMKLWVKKHIKELCTP